MPAISCSSLFPLKRLGSAVRGLFKAPEERAGFELSPWRCVELLQEGRRKCRHRDSERSQGVIQGSRQTHPCPALGELPLLEAGWDHPPTGPCWALPWAGAGEERRSNLCPREHSRRSSSIHDLLFISPSLCHPQLGTGQGECTKLLAISISSVFNSTV